MTEGSSAWSEDEENFSGSESDHGVGDSNAKKESSDSDAKEKTFDPKTKGEVLEPDSDDDSMGFELKDEEFDAEEEASEVEPVLASKAEVEGVLKQQFMETKYGKLNPNILGLHVIAHCKFL